MPPKFDLTEVAATFALDPKVGSLGLSPQKIGNNCHQWMMQNKAKVNIIKFFMNCVLLLEKNINNYKKEKLYRIFLYS